MLTFRFFILLLMIVQKGSSNIKKGAGVSMNDGIDRVVQSLIEPINKLTAVLPNHKIEVQVEYVESNPTNYARSPIDVNSKLLRLHKPHSYYYGRNPFYRAAERSKNRATVTSNAPAVAETHAAATKAKTTNAPTTKKIDPKKRPVNLEDLETALSEFEKRLRENQILSDSMKAKTLAPSLYVSPSGAQTQAVLIHGEFEDSPNQNIDDIMRLLRRGIQVERHVSRPNDNNLDWLEIKVPR